MAVLQPIYLPLAVNDEVAALEQRVCDLERAHYETVAALEQRARDLERANTDLRARLARLEMLESGYVPTLDARYLADAAACRRTRCDSCGHQGMTYEAWFNQKRGSYRAYAKCPQCGWREEW